MSWRRFAKQAIGQVVNRVVTRRQPFSHQQWQLELAADGSLSCDGVPLSGAAAQWGTPLHVVRAGRLRRRAAQFRRGGAKVFFSVKTNPTSGLLRLLFDAGIGAEVVSRTEYALSRRLGMPAERILINGAARDQEWLDQVIVDDAALINLNGAEDLAPVVARARELRRRPKVGLRVVAGGWSGQFGEPESRAAPLLQEMAGSPHLQWTALHFHNGPLLRGLAAADAFLGQALACCERLHRRTGLSPTVLDLGGSLSCPTVDWLSERDLQLNLRFGVPLPPPDADGALSPDTFVRHCEERVSASFQARGIATPEVWLEPGRALVADSQFTLASVRHVREFDGRRVVGLDAGVNILAPIPREYHEVLPLEHTATPRTTETMLIGPLFHPGDVLAQRLRLPRLDRGDVVAIMDTGAYCQASSTQFSFLRPGVVMIDDGRARLIRAAESLEDFVACDERQGAVPRAP